MQRKKIEKKYVELLGFDSCYELYYMGNGGTYENRRR